MKKNLVLLIAFLMWTKINAQTFEIRAQHGGGDNILVQMRCTSEPCPTTSNFVLDLVFGLKWLNSYGNNLGTPSGAYFMAKSGGEIINGVYEFQAFGATSTPYNFPVNWVTNTWITVMTIAVSPSFSGTYEIAEVGFHPTTNPNINVDGVDYTPTINGAASIPLPVELINFQAQSGVESILLDWKTASEVNLNGYRLERSEDGLRFEPIAWVAGKGEGSAYQYEDSNVKKGQLYYYRLKIEDWDGQFEFSPIRTGKLDAVIAFNLYPNPAKNLLWVNMECEDPQDFQITLTDLSGRAISNWQLEAVEELKSIPIDLQGVAPGVYFVEIKGREIKVAEKIIVQ